MVSWGWIPVSFILGGLFGVFLLALLIANNDRDL